MVYVFQTIANFRDMGTSAGKRLRICPNIAFRSATLDHASEEELHSLADEMNVKTIVDLRSELEANLAKAGKPFSTFPVATALKMKPKDLVAPNPDSGSVKEFHDENSDKKTVMINFAGQNFRKHAVWKAAPMKTKLKVVSYYVTGNKHKAVKVVGEEVLSKKGLAGLYRDFVDYCQSEINEALQILADANNYPVLVHCTQGKDRTGLVTALALAAAGVDVDDIVEDYSRSQEGLEHVREQMVAEMAKDGLDPSFADAPPEVMRGTFDYITQKYGSIMAYLDGIGFTAERRAALTALLRSPPIHEQNKVVEQVLTQETDKPPVQNAVVTEVITPSALVDAPPPYKQPIQPTQVSELPIQATQPTIQVTQPTFQVTQPPVQALQVPATQVPMQFPATQVPMQVPTTQVPLQVPATLSSIQTTYVQPTAPIPVTQVLPTTPTLQPLDERDQHLGLRALQPEQQQKILTQQVGATTEEIPAYLPLI